MGTCQNVSVIYRSDNVDKLKYL